MGIGGETVARLKAVVTVDNTGLKRGLAESESATKGSTGRMGKLFHAAGQVSAAGFALIGAAAYEGVKGAVKLQAQMAVLDKQLKNSGASAKQVAGTQSYLEDQSNKTGFAIGDLADSFGKAVTALGSYKKAQRETALAENIARATGESLTMANKQATKVYEGKNTALARLGVVLPKITSAEDHLKATNKNATAAEKLHAKQIDAKRTAMADAKAATDKYKGATDKYGKTLAGQLTIAENRFHNLLDTLGGKLLPVITSVFGFFASHTNILIAVGAAIVGIWVAATAVTFAVKAWSAATKIATAVQWLWNTAMDANPIALVVIALVALVAGIVLAYQHVKVFRDAVNAAWGVIKGAFEGMMHTAEHVFGKISSLISGVVTWLKQHWPLLLAILTGPFGLAVLEIATHWDSIKQGASDVVHWFSGLPGKIGSALSSVGHAISGAFSSVWGGVKSIVIGGINTTIVDPLNRMINGAVHLESLVPGSPNLGIPRDPIPRLARGGFVPGAGNSGRDSVLALLAPGELVLNRSQQGRLAGLLGLDGSGRGPGAGVTINQTIVSSTDNQGVHMQRAKFAAMAAFG